MQNIRYQAATLPPAYHLQALPLESGTTLLLSIGARGELFATRATSAGAQPLASGWEQQDIGAVAIACHPRQGRCTQFTGTHAWAEANRTGVIHLAMVVRDGDGDHLYLSLSNPARDTHWRAAPTWTACPFDGAAAAPAAITTVRISDASDAAWVTVDVRAGDDLVRYAVRAGADGAPSWTELPMQSPARMACLGRSHTGGSVDAVYVAGEAQLLYTPLAHPSGSAAPAPARRFTLPGGRSACALATCRANDDTTDLFAIAQGTLYYFSATNQGEGAQALTLHAHPLFEGVRQLLAATAGGRVTVWGVTEAGQVIHTCVDAALAAEASAWSRPAVVLTDVLAIAPCRDGAQADGILFARTATSVVMAMRSPATEGWTSQAIPIAPRFSWAGAWMDDLAPAPVKAPEEASLAPIGQ